MSKYKLVIFDCDGTLVDSENIIAFACSQVLSELGYMDYGLEECLDLFHAYSIKDSIKYFEKHYEGFPVKKFMDLSNKKLLELYQEKIYAYDDTHHILQYLNAKKIQICVASNGMQAVVRDALIKTDLIQYFREDYIFTYDLIDSAKPEPGLFLYAAKSCGFEPFEALVIEDSAVGVEASNRAKMDVLLIDRLNSGRVIPGDILKTIRSMEEIKEFF